MSINLSGQAVINFNVTKIHLNLKNTSGAQKDVTKTVCEDDLMEIMAEVKKEVVETAGFFDEGSFGIDVIVDDRIYNVYGRYNLK